MAWIVGVLLVAAAYGWLICPRLPRRDAGFLKGFYYAHRGLWNGRCPENSLPAFDRAARRGFGMELDVRLTADGEVCVAHDDALRRMCGVDARISACTMAELQTLRLKNTEHTIPTFAQVLETVGGRTPLIVELKTGANNDFLCRRVLEMLRAYQGAYCVESFDPRIVWWFRANAPEIIRGQLAESPKRPTAAQWFSGSLLGNAMGRPDFVAWGDGGSARLGMKLMLHWLKPYLAVWTVRGEKRLRELEKQYDLIIFEGFWNDDAA